MGRTDTPGSARGRSLGPFVFLWVCLGAAVAYFLSQPFLVHHSYYGPRSSSADELWWVVAALFVPYAYAIRSYLRGNRVPLPLLFGVAAVLYVLLIPAAALQSQDAYQYLLYGRMALHGHNPYVVHAASLRDPWRPWALWDNTRSVYGPLWTLLTVGVVKAAGKSLTAAFLLMKTLAAALALAATGLLAASARGTREGKGSFAAAVDPGFAVLAFAFNPMVLFSVGLGAHTDVIVAAALAGAAASYGRGRDIPSTLLIVAATLVKAYAGVVLLAWLIHLWRRRGAGTAVLHAALATTVAAVAFLPFWHGTDTFAGIADIGRVASTSLVGTIVRLASGHAWNAYAAGSSGAAGAVRVIGLVTLVIAVVQVARSPRTATEPWRAGAILFWVYVLVTPWYLFWHSMGLVALAVASADEIVLWSTLTFSGTSLYVGTGGMAAGLALQAAVRYAPPAVVAYRTRARLGRRGANAYEPSPTSIRARSAPVDGMK